MDKVRMAGVVGALMGLLVAGGFAWGQGAAHKLPMFTYSVQELPFERAPDKVGLARLKDDEHGVVCYAMYWPRKEGPKAGTGVLEQMSCVRVR